LAHQTAVQVARRTFCFLVQSNVWLIGGFGLKKLLKDYLVLLLMVVLVIALDQMSKKLVRDSLAIGEMWAPWPWLLPYARIVHWFNTGVAFGMFQGLGGIFTIVAVVVSGAIIYYFPQVPSSDWTLRLAMGLQMGGALGNMIDRTSQGQVTDFISVGIFPVFNLADACITIGVMVLLLGVYLQERRKKPEPIAQPELMPENREENHLA
jgi:signal peptidase II